MAKLLRRGTPCMVKSIYDPMHNGKVVVVVRYIRSTDSYRCSPDLEGAGGWKIDWYRESLRPLSNGNGEDEMLRRVGKPEVASA